MLEATAQGAYRIVFLCIEMLEGPTFQKILHSQSFQNRLSGIYIDEAHLVHEASHWRSGYTRLSELRKLFNRHIPIVAISATNPSSYRKSLHEFTGMQEDYLLINLGNHRPELETVVIPMEHHNSSFIDIAFILPLGAKIQHILFTIVYCDDLELLTAMFWWKKARLVDMGLPVEIVDILHAGLTPEHQAKVLDDFREGHVKILLASEKIGVGMDFPHVRRVVQYLCKGLTLVRWEQRRGRCARTRGMVGTGYLIAEPRMANGNEATVQSPHDEDPGLLDLIQSPTCCDRVYDKWLENPSRIPSLNPRQCCSKQNCYPQLKPQREHQWIAYQPPSTMHTNTVKTTTKEKELILEQLVNWRHEIWSTKWRSQWPLYGPKAMVADADLENVAKHAGSIVKVDDLLPLTHIIHWSLISGPLFDAVQAALKHVTGHDAPSVDEPEPTPSHTPTYPSHMNSSEPVAVGDLQPGEQVFTLQS